jgi:hypothetical protein
MFANRAGSTLHCPVAELEGMPLAVIPPRPPKAGRRFPELD